MVGCMILFFLPPSPDITCILLMLILINLKNEMFSLAVKTEMLFRQAQSGCVCRPGKYGVLCDNGKERGL